MVNIAQRLVLKTFSDIIKLWCFAPILVFNMGDKASIAFVEPRRRNAVGILR